jgi:hypothetical protein
VRIPEESGSLAKMPALQGKCIHLFNKEKFASSRNFH